MMKRFIKKNWIFFLVSFLTICIMIFGMLEDMNFFNIITRVISDDSRGLIFLKIWRQKACAQLNRLY